MYIEYGLNIPFNKNSSDNHFQSIKQSLKHWTIEIAKFQKEIEKSSRDLVSLIIFLLNQL